MEKIGFSYKALSLELKWDGDKLVEIHFVKAAKNSSHLKTYQKDFVEQLKQYVDGSRTSFDVKYELRGTDFQKKVWKQTAKITYGKTGSYSELARKVGSPKSFRAIGQSMARNPLPILIPCHRVLSSTKKLHGFAGGLELKAYLLRLEGALEIAGLPPSKNLSLASFHDAA